MQFAAQKESWEIFQIEHRKAGILRRMTSPTSNSEIISTTLNIIYGNAVFNHEFKFFNQPGYPPHSYLYDTNDGAPVHVEFQDGQMACQIDEEKFVEEIPVDGRPAYGNFPLIMTMPFESDAIVSYSQIDDGSCTLLGQAELVSGGWYEVTIEGEKHRLWRIDEFLNGQSGNRYWLDENRQIKLTHWKGAISYQVGTKAEAIDSLPQNTLNSIKILLGSANGSDWMDEINDWLNRGY